MKRCCQNGLVTILGLLAISLAIVPAELKAGDGIVGGCYDCVSVCTPRMVDCPTELDCTGTYPGRIDTITDSRPRNSIPVDGPTGACGGAGSLCSAFMSRWCDDCPE